MIGKKPPNQLKQEIAWLKREKYGLGEVQLQVSPKLDFAQARQFKKDLERLNDGEPLDYVIGWRDFLGCRIDLSAKPLIPRAETEFWVEQAIKELGEMGEAVRRDRFLCNEMGSRKTKTGVRNHFNFAKPNKATCEVAFSSTKNDFSRPLRVLDLFAGSGCIGLAVLKHCPNAHVTFGEKDPKLCAQIKKNLKLNQIPASRAKVSQTNLFKPYLSKFDFDTLQKGGKLDRFDVVLANPPYVPTRKSKVQKSVKDWEPKEALFAGKDGLVIIKKFLKQARLHLESACPERSRRGKIYLEFGYGQKLAITKLLKQFGYSNWQFHQDQFGKWRWVVVE
jgi:release factor glutamine methyltransferase